MWRAHGPARARYWALNANHDMYCGGYGYFGHLLPAIGQPASYFSLGNDFWRLIGLDTGYVARLVHDAPDDVAGGAVRRTRAYRSC